MSQFPRIFPSLRQTEILFDYEFNVFFITVSIAYTFTLKCSRHILNYRKVLLTLFNVINNLDVDYHSSNNYEYAKHDFVTYKQFKKLTKLFSIVYCNLNTT